jgi:hypothetical protein
LIAKILLAITMAVSAILGGSGAPHPGDAVSGMGAFYLHTDERGVPTLWSESNGLAGLQTDVSLGPGGAIYPPDTHVTL